MGALLSLPITLLNFLLPFTKHGTPILQDLIHTAVLCGTLYYAPQIAEWYNTRQLGNTSDGVGHDEGQDQGQDTQQAEPHETHETHNTHQADPPRNRQPGLQAQVEDEDELVAPQPGPVQQAEQPPFENAFAPADPNAEAGPAHERPRPTPQNRAVGAKKAKSLARKDQRRAYHEFHRQEAELRRLQAAEGAEERDAALAAEKARRAAAEAEIVERERREREERKRELEREQEEEQKRRERVVDDVREQAEKEGAVDLVDVAWKEGKDRVWVERLVRASGVLAKLAKNDAKVVITSHGWLVKVDKELMEKVYAEAERFGEGHEGKVGFGDFGAILERTVKARAKV